jgi:CDP-glucose 4,6-dehydratase
LAAHGYPARKESTGGPVGIRPCALETVDVTPPRDPDPAFWEGKRVLVTGHTGFKGAWLAIWLRCLGADVTGIALPPAGDPNLFNLAGVDELCDNRFLDIRDAAGLAALVREAKAQIVLHLAAQALVREAYRDPLNTFTTNVTGTTNVLDALRGSRDTRVAVMVTTDKVYRNNEQATAFRETDPLGGHDPYSASKAAAEIVIASYRDALLKDEGIAVASARAGNVIGGGDWSNDRLIPDAVRAWQSHEVLQVRRPAATRPWQHVLEPLSAYLILAEALWRRPALADAYNFGPVAANTATVRSVVEHARASYGEGNVNWGDGSEGPHEAGWLALDITKARTVLQIEPRWSTGQAINRAMAWYRAQKLGADARSLCEAEIAAYLGDS